MPSTPSPSPSQPSQASCLADLAASSIATARSSHYTHAINIDAARGVYHCDCSGFLEFLLGNVAKEELAPIQKAARAWGDSRVLARDFHSYFEGARDGGDAGLGESVLEDGGVGGDATGWGRVEKLADARRGDVISWSLKQSADTGHVVIVADTPMPVPLPVPLPTPPLDSMDGTPAHDQPGQVFELRVYDASCIPHEGDSRGEGMGFRGGIGEGGIRIDVDELGGPRGFRFSRSAGRHIVPFCIARLLG